MKNQVILEMKNIIKDFPGVRALKDITFTARKGEILALVGENGAGKSTLMKILSGVHPYRTYQGEIFVKGKLQKFRNTKDAQKAAIAIIHQELNLIPNLSVAENIFLGSEPAKLGIINSEELYCQTSNLLKQLNLDINPAVLIKDLGIGKQQMVEIAKALKVKAEILILDEPTSALTEQEIKTLFSTLRALKAKGVTCIYISHKLDEIFQIADRIAALRDGSTVGEASISELDHEKIIAMMVGRKIEDMYPKESAPTGEVLLEIRDFFVDHPFLPGEKVVKNINFKVKAGEILGITGLMGSGRSELVTAIFGAFPSDSSGKVYINGKEVKINSPLEAIKYGIGLATEDRKLFGLVLSMSTLHNTTLASLDNLSRLGVINKDQEREVAEKFIQELRVKVSDVQAEVSTLSGGNQQKVVLAKWLACNLKVLFLDEPTRGIDVGAKVEIYKILNELVKQGVAIVMISSNLPEVLKLSDRILVMREGEMQAELKATEADQEIIMSYATGGRK